MYVSFEDGGWNLEISDLRHSAAGRLLFHWKGHLFIEGHPAGEPSLAVFARDVEEFGIPKASSHLRGIFVLLVQHGHDYALMVDNSGLYRIYLTSQRLANSLLRLLDNRRAPAYLDALRAVEFLNFGACYGHGTLVRSIRILGPRTIVHFSERSGSWSFDSKSLPEVATGEYDMFDRYCEALITACGGKVLGADLTGGFDSRLLVTLLTHYGARLECGVFGPAASVDVRIAKRVAAALRLPLHHQLPPSGGRITDELHELFTICDGVLSPVEQWTAIAMQRDRSASGTEVLVSGNGGELFKDFWWWQDFPFYGIRTPNLHRLLQYRMHPLRLVKQHLTPTGTKHYDQMIAGTLRRMRRLATTRNTETYDNIYFFIRQNAHNGPVLSYFVNHFFDVVAPYLEYTNFLFARALPVRARIFNNYHRRQLWRINQAVASLPTTSQVTASATAADVASDVVRYGRWAVARLAKKVGEVHLQRATAAPADWQDEALDALRASATVSDSLRSVKAIGLLAEQVQVTDLSLQELGRLLTVSMLVDRYGLVNRL